MDYSLGMHCFLYINGCIYKLFQYIFYLVCYNIEFFDFTTN